MSSKEKEKEKEKKKESQKFNKFIDKKFHKDDKQKEEFYFTRADDYNNGVGSECYYVESVLDDRWDEPDYP